MIKATKSVVVATEDPVIINQIGSILVQHDYSILVEKSAIKSILKILEQEIYFLILDLDILSNSHLDLINIIRKTRPRLPIVVLSEDNSLETVRELSQAGVFYCALKPIQTGEIEEVFEALERFHEKQNYEIQVVEH